jgi:Fe-S cluster biosynthesis and repair protein YggX
MAEANAAAAAEERIQRFKYMTDADPDNELGHFSLGKAYFEVGRHADAVESLRRAIAINKNLSKAYQLIAQSQLKLDKPGDAVATLTEGVKIAHSRGEMLPRNEMVEMLKSLGAAVPDLPQAGTKVEAGEGEVLCRRCGQVKPRLPGPPMRNEFGRLIYQNTCAACWREAIGMGTKVINEMRLDLSDPRAQKVWDQNIREFLNLPT